MDEETTTVAIFNNPDLVHQLVTSSNKFAFTLFKRLCSHCGNILLNPLSVSALLSMLLMGAKGDTANQIKQLLHLQNISTDEDENENPEDADFQIHVAYQDLLESFNSDGTRMLQRLYIQEDVPFSEDISNQLEKHYGESLAGVNFGCAADEARDEINSWVQEKIGTTSWQKGLVGEGVLDLFTVLVAISAATFQGDWAQPFDESATHFHKFQVGNGREIIVDLMRMRSPGEFRYAIDEDLHCQILELPYQVDRFSLLILVPSDHDNFHDIEDKLDSDTLDSLIARLELSSIRIALPRFSVACTFSMSDIIGEMGANLLLDPDGADLTPLGGSQDEGLYLSSLIHGTELRVGEKGTECSSPTPPDDESRMDEGDENEITVDKPFIFLLRDTKSGLILFIGTIHEPTTEVY